MLNIFANKWIISIGDRHPRAFHIIHIMVEQMKLVANLCIESIVQAISKSKLYSYLRWHIISIAISVHFSHLDENWN